MLAEPYAFGAANSRLAPFTFDASNIPKTILRFSKRLCEKDVVPKSMKRHRSIADVDGEGLGCLQKKKRRLRLELVTSRLSRPYATPTTYIVSRGTIKISKQLRPRLAGRSLLRRAAIINWMRRRRAQTYGRSLGQSQQRFDQEPSIYDDTFDSMEEDTNMLPPPKPTQHHGQHSPRTPSPLGLSNYEALDSEGDPYDDGVWCETSDDLLNSDFNKRDPVQSVDSDLDVYPSLQFDVVSPSSDKHCSKDIMEIVADDDKQQEISFAQFD